MEGTIVEEETTSLALGNSPAERVLEHLISQPTAKTYGDGALIRPSEMGPHASAVARGESVPALAKRRWAIRTAAPVTPPESAVAGAARVARPRRMVCSP